MSGRAKLWWIVSAIAGIIAAVVVLGAFGMNTLRGIRGFVQGEGLYAKRQKDATHHLLRYAYTGDEAEHAAFLDNLRHLRELSQSRLELTKPEPDRAVVAEGLIQLGLHREDVGSMYDLFRRFRSLEFVEEAIDIWTRGDRQLDGLRAHGVTLQRLRQQDRLTTAARRKITGEIANLNQRLGQLEYRFSAVLGEAGRWAQGVLLATMFGAALLALLGCFALAMAGARIIRRSQLLAKERSAQHWLKESEAALSDHLVGADGEAALAADALSYLAQRLGAQLGALYVTDDEGGLRRAAGYAQSADAPTTFGPGEGLVGQVALDRELLRVCPLPEGYSDLRSAVGQGAPRELLLQPLVLDARTVGVVELASVASFSPQAVELLGSASRSLAIALDRAHAQARVTGLLVRTQCQAHDLQQQQETLRQANAGLEEQAEALRASKQRLQEQQRALQEANAELEEQTQALRESDSRMQQQQRALEETNAEIEERTQALELERQAVARQNKELEASNRYKSEFLANMSHELRTPLNSILVLSRMLAGGESAQGLSDKQRQFAQTVHDSGAELLSLINDILDLAKIEAGKLDLTVAPLSLPPLLEGLERQFRPICAERGLSLELEVGELCELRSDEQRLAQVLKNLLANATKFTPRSGSVSLVAHLASDADADADVPTPAVVLTVKDSGVGIPLAKQQQIFEAFQQADGTTSRQYGGTGLGLSISRDLVGLLGGRISVVSAPGEGSAFSVVLPHRPPSDDARDAPPKPRPERPSVELVRAPLDQPGPSAPASDQGRTVLIIEDDPGFASCLSAMAEARGFTPLIAGTGDEGIAVAEQQLPSAVLLDVGLPDVSGLDVLQRLKSSLRTRHIPVHLVSGIAEPPGSPARLGAIGFSNKPVSDHQLAEVFGRIEQLIAGPRRSLLVVEDDTATLTAIRAMLAGRDVEVQSATTGEAARALLAARSYDCLVLDLGLPDVAGVELLRELRADPRHAELPVVVYTGRQLEPTERMLVEQHADRLIAKDGRSLERLLDDTALFLHRVEAEMDPEKRRAIRMLYDSEALINGRKILVVDDDMRNIFAVSALLEEHGARLLFARDGAEALARLDEHPDVDLVLMDIMMPRMDGYEATRRIRAQARFAQLPVIALTAKALPADRAPCIEAGANDYLPKPLDTERLLSALRVWLYDKHREGTVGGATCAA